jgi:TonB family protein
MFLNFEDARPDTPTIERAISLREGVMISVFVHAAIVALLVFGPRLPFVKAALDQARQAQEARQLALEQERRQQQENARFVFVQPRIDTPAPAPPPRAELSDQDRVARSVERAPNPTNPLPYSQGNTSERIEAQPDPPQRARGSGPAPEASAPSAASAAPGQQPQGADGSNGYAFERGATGPSVRPEGADRGAQATPSGAGGGLGEALKNLQRYVQNQNFHNPDGGGQFGPAIQFDTKGVEFGPWIRRFIAQIRRNWFIPYAAMSLRGHVVLTFNVHKDGSITDLTVLRPSSVEAFNNSAYNALLGSNPTQELPAEYPADKAFFTVTFYYNEQPPSP